MTPDESPCEERSCVGHFENETFDVVESWAVHPLLIKMGTSKDILG